MEAGVDDRRWSMISRLSELPEADLSSIIDRSGYRSEVPGVQAAPYERVSALVDLYIRRRELDDLVDMLVDIYGYLPSQLAPKRLRLFILGGVTTDDRERQATEQQMLRSSSVKLGQQLGREDCDVLVCSPFADSVDVMALEGISSTGRACKAQAHMHYPRNGFTDKKIAELRERLQLDESFLTAHGHAAEAMNTYDGRKYSYLLSQLQALKAAHVTVALGGRTASSASLLLSLAAAQGNPVLPFSWLGGAAAAHAEANWTGLQQRLGTDAKLLSEPDGVADAFRLALKLVGGQQRAPEISDPRRCFISYPHRRPKPAARVHKMLEKSGRTVVRDVTLRDEGLAGEELGKRLAAELEQAELFVATWSQEYACSPHCMDELERALRRWSEGRTLVWIVLLDGTRLVPKIARRNLKALDPIPGTETKLLESNIAARLQSLTPS